MSDGVHLLIPFAYSNDEGCGRALDSLALPHLERLLARLAPGELDRAEDTSLSMPHERVLAREFGLSAPDGQIPLAAWRVEQAGRDTLEAAWAHVTPCHWRVGSNHVAMAHPQDLHLDERDAQALLAAMQPFFEQDGIALEYDAPTLWLARGEIFRDLPTASIDRVVGRPIDAWMPRAPSAGTIRRLQQEMQMLLYTHEINETRQRGGLLPVNSFWVSGTGALPASRAAAAPAGLYVTHYLRDAALQGDWRGWAAAWHQLDTRECLRVAEALAGGQRVALTLCGERNAQTWTSDGRSGWGRRVASLFGRKNAADVLRTL